jgi:hypothetical protein
MVTHDVESDRRILKYAKPSSKEWKEANAREIERMRDIAKRTRYYLNMKQRRKRLANGV